MKAEEDNFDSSVTEGDKISSIYDSSIGLPIFPNQFKYLVESNYEILATMKTPDDLETFIAEYSNNSCSEWRVLRTYTKLSLNILYKRAWRCQYNVQQRRRNPIRDINRIKVSKNCHCPGYICISLLGTSAKRGVESHLYEEFTARIKLNLDHNHDLSTKAALRNRTLDFSIKDKIEHMFQYGHGASAAIKLHLLDLLMINENQYFHLIHDGKYMPSVSQVQHYLNNLKKDLEIYDLNDVIEEYLVKNPEAQVRYFCIQCEVNKVITIITPFMMKVHQHILRSGEVISISLSSKLNRLGTTLLTLSTHSELGPMPLGLLIIQQNEEAKINVLSEALNEFIAHASSDSFFNGQGYPRVILTDNELVPAVSAVWTKSLILISQRSVLKTVWTWLHDGPNGVQFAEREGFFYSFKKIMNSASIDECEKSFAELVQYCSEAYPNYLKFVESLMINQHLWIDHHRIDKLRRLHLSGIQLESSSDDFHVEIISTYVYDQLLAKIKNLFCTLPEMLNFVLNHLETYYYIRMLKLMNHNFPKSMLSKYIETDEKPQKFALQASDFDRDCYFVLSSDVYHYVDYKQKLCSSNTKNASSPCPHINAVLNHKYKISEYAIVDQSIQDLCRLLMSDQYSNLCVNEHSVVVINTSDSRKWTTKEMKSKQTEQEILGDHQTFHDSRTVDDNQTMYDNRRTVDENETIITSEDDVEYVTVSVSDFKMHTLDDNDVEQDSISHHVIEQELEVTDQEYILHQTNQPDIKQEPPDHGFLIKKPHKRKLDTSDSTNNVEILKTVTSSQLTGPFSERGAKLVSLKRMVRQFPEVFSGAIIQKAVVGSGQNTILLQRKGMYSIAQTTSLKDEGVGEFFQEVKLLEDDNIKAITQNQQFINQNRAVLPKPPVVGEQKAGAQRGSVFSLSDNVIIIDPNLKKVPNTIDSNINKEVEVQNDERKFNEICAIIKQNPSQYKTVMRNMIDVYETFYGDS